MFVELSEFAKWQSAEQVKEHFIRELRQSESERFRQSVDRMLRDGRVTFLLDSLDQAAAYNPCHALSVLTSGPWRNCRVWVSGRPYAFRDEQSKLQAMCEPWPWEFMRIGPLDEAEACQNIEMIAGTER